MSRAADLRHRFEAALSTLPPLTCAIFVAHRFDRKTYREIADECQISITDVEREIAQAVYQLAEAADSRPAKSRRRTRF